MLSAILATAFLLTCVAVRPAAVAVAPVRLAIARAAVILAGFAVMSVELLSAVGWLNRAGVLVVWLLANAAAATAVLLRHRAARPESLRPVPLGDLRARVAATWASASPLERVIAGTLVALALIELTLAVASPPNTFDSQTYHLPRIEWWVQRGSVDHFPTRIHRQVTFPPGAEYLLLTVRLLTGGDRFYNLLQCSAGLLCLTVVTRIVAQLGGTRRAQLLAGLVVGTVPLVVLESSSTQTDLVMAGWVACLCTVVLDALAPGRRADATTFLLCGLAGGLITITKPPGLLAAGPLLVWLAVNELRDPARTRALRDPARTRALRDPARTRALGRVAAGAAGVAGLTALLVGPSYLRGFLDWGNPWGPPFVRQALTTQRHDPAAIIVNGLRDVQTIVEVPVPALNAWTGALLGDLARSMGVNPNDPAITFYGTSFPADTWHLHEDVASLPVQALLLTAGTLAALRPDRTDGRRRWLAVILIVASIGYAIAFKWQPWGNRLVLFLVVLAGPLTGIWLDRVFAAKRRLLRAVVAGVLVLAALAGLASAVYGFPRRLIGTQSPLVLDDWSARFIERTSWAHDYADVAAKVRASGAQRIGLVQWTDSWEYPWWIAFRGRQMYALQSFDPQRIPPARLQDVDAVVCTAEMAECRAYLPAGWTVAVEGVVMYALPPER